MVVVLDFRSDGTWILYEGSGLGSLNINISGTYTTTRDTFTFETDNSCYGQDPDSEKATCSWKLENDQLTFTGAGADACEGRSRMQNGLTLSPVE